VEREQIGACTLYRGDCREVLPTLGEVDAVLTDIPYGVGMHAFDDDLSIGIEGLDMARCQRAITWLSPGKIAAFVLQTQRWTVRRVLWMEKAADLSYPWRGWLMNSEAILVLDRPGATWPSPGTYHRDCYTVAPWGKTGHPTSKPLMVATDLLNKLAEPGETVLDMFAGSCTTALACMALSCAFIGIEKDPRWFDLGCQRITDAYAQPDLFVPQPVRPQQQALFAGGRDRG
jgi:site-specific DNA-methyltransferase (adenine-specific)